MTPPENTTLAEAIAAARAGDRSRARDLLARLLKSDSANAEYWVWMSSVVDTKRERIYCLESALNLDPTNRAALRGLVILGARKPDEGKRKKTPVPRRKVVAAGAGSGRRGLQFTWQMFAAAVIGIVFFAVLGGVVLAFQGTGSGLVMAPTLPPPTATQTPTSVIPTATLTPVPAETGTFRTPIPTELASTPIAFFVDASPTPTPILGLTPHPGFEAYGQGIDALQRGDYEAAAEFMQQVIELDRTLPDAHYFRGEALRRGGSPGSAVRAYDQAILLDSEFAPAYLGRARTLIAVTIRESGELRAQDIPADFDRAIESDPRFTEAYLAKAEVLGSLRLWRTMEETLQAALEAEVRQPAIYIELSEAQYNRDNFEAALENALQGSAQDPTNLEGYLAIGRAHTALDQFDQALWPLQTYVAYHPEDARGWGHLARTHLRGGEIQAALEAANRAIEQNDRYAPAYATRAMINVQLDRPDAALTDIQAARRFGAENYFLVYAFANVHLALEEYVDAVRMVNLAVAEAETPARRAESYALRALIYEATNPPLLDEAILNWQWVLDTEGAHESTVELARTHLAALTGEGPTLTPVPSRTPTPTTTATALTATATPKP